MLMYVENPFESFKWYNFILDLEYNSNTDSL